MNLSKKLLITTAVVAMIAGDMSAVVPEGTVSVPYNRQLRAYEAHNAEGAVLAQITREEAIAFNEARRANAQGTRRTRENEVVVVNNGSSSSDDDSNQEQQQVVSERERLVLARDTADGQINNLRQLAAQARVREAESTQRLAVVEERIQGLLGQLETANDNRTNILVAIETLRQDAARLTANLARAHQAFQQAENALSVFDQRAREEADRARIAAGRRLAGLPPADNRGFLQRTANTFTLGYFFQAPQ